MEDSKSSFQELLKRKLCRNLNRICALDYPLYGLLTLAANFVLAFHIVTRASSRMPGPKGQTCTVFGWVAPQVIFSEPVFFVVAKYLFLLFALLWILHLSIQASSWLAYFFYTLSTSISVEGFWDCEDHTGQIVNIFLFLHALWYQSYGRAIVEAIRNRRLLGVRLLPKWLYGLQILYIAVSYSYSGLQKLLHSGLQWANGVSLQIWVDIFNDSPNFLSRLIMNDRDVAFLLQVIVLIAESTAFLAIFSRKLRLISGLLLISFHLGNELLFGWRFYGNLTFTALVFLPFYNLCTSYSAGLFASHRNARLG